jgi:hypothetical protein
MEAMILCRKLTKDEILNIADKHRSPEGTMNVLEFVDELFATAQIQQNIERDVKEN